LTTIIITKKQTANTIEIFNVIGGQKFRTVVTKSELTELMENLFDEVELD